MTEPGPPPATPQLEGSSATLVTADQRVPLARRERWLLALILVVAALLRVGAFLEANAGPATRLTGWSETDMAFFDDWAGRIAEDDALGREPLHPLHGWHRAAAAAHFAEHPELLGGREPSEEDAAALWTGWWGGTRFHQEPLYPYGIAAVYAYVDREPRLVLVLQQLLGLLGIGLTWLLTRRLFGPGAALAAAALLTLSAPHLAYELVLLRATAIGVAGVGLALLLEWGTRQRPAAPGAVVSGVVSWGVLGLACGAAVLLKATFVLVLPAAALLAGLAARRDGRRDGRRVATPILALFLGAALAGAPLVARNVAVGAPPLSVSSVGAVALTLGLSADYDPDRGAAIDPQVYARTFAETDGAVSGSLVAALGSHDGAGALLWFLGRKALAVVRDFEAPNNVSFAHLRSSSHVLSLLPRIYPLLLGVGLVGCFLALRRDRAVSRLAVSGALLIVIVHAVALVPGAVIGRYRLPLLVALAPFAGLATQRAWSALSSRRFVPLASGLGALLGVILATQTPTPMAPVRISDHTVDYVLYWLPEATAAGERGAHARVRELAHRARSREPSELREIVGGRPVGTVEELGLVRSSAKLYRREVVACELLGDLDAARAAQVTLEALERAAD